MNSHSLQNFKIKVSSPTEAHIIQLPKSLQNLKFVILTIFQTPLPQHWDLVYFTSDNQQITLLSEQEFQDLPKDPSKSIKVFIKERQILLETSHDPLGISEFQVIEGESMEVDPSQALLASLQKPRFIPEKTEIDLEEKPVDESHYHQGLNQNSSIGLQRQIDDLQKKLEDLTDFRKVLESNSNISQLSKDDVPLYMSEVVIAPKFHLQMPAAIKQQQIPQPQINQQAEGPFANLRIDENTLEEMFQKMINQNIHNIASKTANILQNRGFQPQNQPEDQAVHVDAKCHECGTAPIIGIKYKCLVCTDYEVCELCEATHDHIHALLKIKRPGQQYKLLQEEQGGYSKAVSLVQSDYFEVPVPHGEKPVEDEEEKSSISQRNRGGGGGGIIKKSVKFVLEPEVLEIINEESKIEDKQVVEEEENNNLGVQEMEEEKPAEIYQENILISQEVRKVYSAQVIEKAKQLHELLPESILEELLEFVNNSASDVDVVELMERFQLL